MEDLKKEAGSDYIVNVSIEHSDFEQIREAFSSIPEIQDIVHTGTKDGLMDFYLSCRSEKDLRSRIYSIIRGNDWPLLEFHMETKTLENIFRELTKER
jgi:hypothetical protein